MPRTPYKSKISGAEPPSSRRFIHSILLTVVSAVIVLLLLYFFFRPEIQGAFQKADEAKDQVASQLTESVVEVPEVAGLVGKWKRADGDYTIEILRADANGGLEAGYFNPNPIHIGRAEWAEDKGYLYVMIELQDVNYPGSTYGLQYDPDNNQLVGRYFQAVDESVYDVQFDRTNDD